MLNSKAIGVDIGGTHITAALIDLQTKKVVPNSLLRSQINTHASSDEIVDNWCNVIGKIIGQLGTSVKIGIAMPGPFDYPNGISLIKGQNKLEALYGLNVKEALGQKLNTPTENIHMQNDAECFLQGETFGGVGRGYDRAVGLTLGTGFGTATYKNRAAQDADLWCSPFKDSIAENYISTRWFVNQYFQKTGEHVEGVKDLVAKYLTEPIVQGLFKEFGNNLGAFLSDFISTEKAQIVVLGGNIANAENLFIDETLQFLKKQSIFIPVKKAVLGEQASLLGAASYWETSIKYA